MSIILQQPTKSLIEIHSHVHNCDHRRSTIQERMNRLGINELDYEMYEQMFLKCRERNHFITLNNEGWREIRHPWGKDQILRHIAGERTVGLFPTHQIDYVMIDIDRHNEEGEASVRLRIKQVIEAMGGDPLVYQSSFSGGMRLCFFLTEALNRDLLLLGYKNLFQNEGIPIKQGFIEIMAGRKGDRLPFGEGSYLVDLFTFEPIYHFTPQETISRAFNIFQFGKLEIPLTMIGSGGVGTYDLIVNKLHNQGLYPEVTTNEALLKLSYDLVIRRGYSKEEAENYLKQWIQDKHNGFSNRANQGRIDDIFSQINRIVARTDPCKVRYRGSKYAIREKKLSLSDVCQIISLTGDEKLQLAIFTLLEYCLCFGKTYPHTQKDITKISNFHVSEKGHVTYVSGFQQNYYCEISQQTLRHLNGFDKANPQTTMQKIETLGIVSLKRKAHPQSHHCRQYWVYFPFNEDDPVKLVSLDEGLVKLGSKDNHSQSFKKEEGGNHKNAFPVESY